MAGRRPARLRERSATPSRLARRPRAPTLPRRRPIRRSMGSRQSAVRVGVLIAGLAAMLAWPAAAALHYSYIPIPEIITDPNEGNTFGVLGVVLFLDEKDEIQYMLAPDIRYNDTKGTFPTF